MARKELSDASNEYRQAMVTDRRVMLRLRPTHAYGMVRSS